MLSTDEMECRVWNCLLRYFISPEGYDKRQQAPFRLTNIHTHMLVRHPALEPLQPMPFKHDLGRPRRDPHPIHKIQSQRHDTKSGRRAPKVARVEGDERGHR